MTGAPTGHAYLGYNYDVRSHAAIFEIEHASRPSEPTLHLVDDEQQTMFVADGAQPLQESWRRRDVPTFSQHRLDDDRGGV